MFCPRCGNEAAPDQAYCRHCGTRIAPDAGIDPNHIGRSKTPWEDRAATGLPKALFATAKEALFTPTDFFRKMPVTGGLTDPLLFALITGTTGMMFLFIWDILLHNSLPAFMMPEMQTVPGGALFLGFGTAVFAVITPLMLLVSLFVVSGLLHLLLFVVRGARAGFEATFRVVGYGMSSFLLLIIPYCGTLITLFWGITLAIIGLKEAHGTTGGRAAFAVLFPFLFCCGLSILAVALFMGAAAASFGDMWYQ